MNELYNQKKYSCLYKYLYFTLENNKFIKRLSKDLLMDNFRKNIKLIRAINIISRNFFIRKQKLISHNKYLLDLDTESKYVINSLKVYNNYSRSFYTFSQSEILQIFKHSLLNSCDTFPEPYIPKNPWTNMEFSLSECIYLLNNIKLKKPKIIDLFIDSNYSIEILANKYENYLIEKSCENYTEQLSDEDFRDEVKTILSEIRPKPCYECLETILNKDFRKILYKIVEKSVKETNLNYINYPGSIKMMKNVLMTLKNMGKHNIHRVIFKPIYKNNITINFTNHNSNELFIFG